MDETTAKAVEHLFFVRELPVGEISNLTGIKPQHIKKLLLSNPNPVVRRQVRERLDIESGKIPTQLKD